VICLEWSFRSPSGTTLELVGCFCHFDHPIAAASIGWRKAIVHNLNKALGHWFQVSKILSLQEQTYTVLDVSTKHLLNLFFYVAENPEQTPSSSLSGLKAFNINMSAKS
jgi:hypothetical protein